MRNPAPIISCKENHNQWAPDHAIERGTSCVYSSKPENPGETLGKARTIQIVEGMNRYWGYMKEDRRSYIQACTGIYFHIFITS